MSLSLSWLPQYVGCACYNHLMSVLFNNVGPVFFFLTAFNSSGDHHFFPISCLSNISLKDYIMSNFLFKRLLMHLVEILLIGIFLEEPLTKHFSIKHKH